jgi:hypothetical protein
MLVTVTAAELKGYDLAAALVTKLVKARTAENETGGSGRA